ncbi:MAG: hypothetical protein ACP5JH_05415 [Bacteroidota bacterium]
MKRAIALLVEILILTIYPLALFGQGTEDPRVPLYRAEPKGNYQYRREGVMDGNRIRTLYYNDGEVGYWPYAPSGEWPKGSGHTYLDGVAVLIGARVVAPGNGQVIHPIESEYREEMDRDPVTGEIWGLEPVPGYLNPSPPAPSKPKPAVNVDPNSWPEEWPRALGLTPEWNGYWYGYFGRGVSNADFETFFVTDDSRDKEFTRPPYNYYPIASDSDRGGLGLRVEVRGFQWSHVLAEDIIFWHYDIVNISDHDYDTVAFGFYTDPGVGGGGGGNNSALFDRSISLCYAWNPSGVGIPDNWRTGYYGYAYLESPGNPWDGIDNDGDGMVDERRDDNIDNDHDWVSYTDLNGNGRWDPPNEPLNDDLGRDGVGPYDPQYRGPDEGEGDGVPTHGEPNFDETDKDESDQIGLTAVSVYPLWDKGPSGGWPKNDEVMWKKMNGGFRDTTVQNSNISIVFASGPFPLKKGRRERFSMALVFGDNLADLIFKKNTVQAIYNANYNFSQPPYKPHLTAIPGNHKVVLYWDNVAENSYDRFLRKRDFEGYLVYRSSDPEFNDIKLITDSKGEPKFWKPIAQFDLVDGIKGPDPVGINGAHFWRGTDSGLQHSYVDTAVENGVRYYYAIVSYDKGDPSYGSTGLAATECSKVITVDYAGNLKFVDINCAVVTPNAYSAGYVPPSVRGDVTSVAQGLGTGSLSVEVINPLIVRSDATYKVVFHSTGSVPVYRTTTYDILRESVNGIDTLYWGLDAMQFGPWKTSPPFDGLIVSFDNDTVVAVVDSLTGWIVGNSNVVMKASADKSNPSRNIPWPADYEIKFFETTVDTTAFNVPPFYPMIPTNFTITNITYGYRVKYVIYDADRSGSLTAGDTIRILEGDVRSGYFKIPWKVSFGAPPNANVVLPTAGDRFIIRVSKPFFSGDYFRFSMKQAKLDTNLARNRLDNIGVVPNPYIATAKWEPRTLYQTGRGERRIEFINLPPKCTIRIYTITGALVKTLYKDSSPLDGSLSWDLISEDGMDIAYGLYVFHVDAPGIGEYIGRFAVIK